MSSVGGEITITDLGDDPDRDAVRDFIVDWVTGSRAATQEYLADHADGEGSTLTARIDQTVVGLVTMRWTSHNPAFAEHRIPLVHQLIVVPEFRQMGVGDSLLDAAERLAAQRGRQAVGITVGLFDEYGPAQRLYAKRGYVPDGRGVCRGNTPLHDGETVKVDHSLIIWLTKDISDLHFRAAKAASAE